MTTLACNNPLGYVVTLCVGVVLGFMLGWLFGVKERKRKD